MAASFPPMAGIITAIVGGVLVSRISGSFVTINGPAAGLIVVVFDAVESLSEGNAMAGYRYTLAAIFVASIFQVVMGLCKAGRLSSFFPASVVHGMLAAIGIIIMAKQIHVMLGVTPEAGSLFSTIGQIPHSLLSLNDEIAVIAFCGLAIMIIWSIVKNRFLKMIPAPLIVVLVGIGFGRYFDLEHEHIYLFLPDFEFLPHHAETIGPKFLVTISDNFMSSFYFPDFSKVLTVEFWKAVVSISLVGSLESLLSAAAVDKLDPYKRHSNLDRDLTAVGAGNLVASSIGGFPMIAEIVRSSANVNNGAKTGWANFSHGLFLLLFVALFPRIIHSIPLAALAALLVFTGYRLAAPAEFVKVFRIGKDQLLIFLTTIICVIATDLLVGVAIGIVVNFGIHLTRGVKLKNLFTMRYKIEQIRNDSGDSGDSIVVRVEEAAIFSNLMAFKKALSNLESGQTIVFELSESYLLDHTMMEFFHDFQHDYESHGGKCTFLGLDHHTPVSKHPLAARKGPVRQ